MKNSTSTYSLRLGFTLVEMLVVIGIIGILAGVMLSAMNGAGDSAQAAKCLTNLKNLSTAVLATKQTWSNGKTKYAPPCSSCNMDINWKNNKPVTTYTEVVGWLSWDSKDMFPATSKPNPPMIGCYETNDDVALFAITNGAIWKYMNGNSKSYCCPLHLKKRPGAHWSYFMNAAINGKMNNVNDRTLMFAEMPFQGPLDNWNPGDSEEDTDSVLQYKRSAEAKEADKSDYEDGNEHIGANHKQGKMWFAHVSFMDGHVEKIRIGAPNLQELTTFLCEGTAYTLEGGKYVELK